MFDYDKDDLYERCGYKPKPYNPDSKPYPTGTYYEMTDGTKIPIYKYPEDHVRKFEYDEQLVLETFKGFIPVKDIETFWDIFDKSKYVSDGTEWIKKYDEENASDEYKIQVKLLARTLKRHWKPNKK